MTGVSRREKKGEIEEIVALAQSEKQYLSPWDPALTSAWIPIVLTRSETRLHSAPPSGLVRLG